MELQIEQVISELSKIDNACESIITSSDVEKDNYAKKINHEKKIFDAKLKEDLDTQLDKFRKKLEIENSNVISQMNTNMEAELKTLEEAFQANHTKIAKELFNELIKE